MAAKTEEDERVLCIVEVSGAEKLENWKSGREKERERAERVNRISGTRYPAGWPVNDERPQAMQRSRAISGVS